MIVRIVFVFVLLLAGCTTNTCQDLCESFYQMQLRCDLYGQQSGLQPDSCMDAEMDPQTLNQRADYAIRQCRQDFRDPSDQELVGCCKSVCFKELLEQYDSSSGTREVDYEKQRDLCRQYRQLAELGETPWCSSLQVDCRAEAAGTADGG